MKQAAVAPIHADCHLLVVVFKVPEAGSVEVTALAEACLATLEPLRTFCRLFLRFAIALFPVLH